MLKEIEIPDGHELFPYFVKSEDALMAIACFAEMTGIEYIVDEDGERTDEIRYSIEERARMSVKKILDKKLVKYQKRQVVNSAMESGVIKTDIIS